ncbi:peroxidase 29 [Tripterygium wilfordii]|uniref:peroxidase 29 n=1 Tax=Tripterygium wilfordii TaxID=458696 RepID=UPI0018F84A83|nr:peroxidase 29 [Tripterygium wilfordii]
MDPLYRTNKALDLDTILNVNQLDDSLVVNRSETKLCMDSKSCEFDSHWEQYPCGHVLSFDPTYHVLRRETSYARAGLMFEFRLISDVHDKLCEAKGQGISSNFYEKSCPQLENLVRTSLATIFITNPTSPSAMLRLMFHDCQVQGCDASILIDPVDQENMATEMGSSRNFGIRETELISTIKSLVEAECPQQVSCADILILAARDAVALSGGPLIDVPLGRRDSSIYPSYKLADSQLPPPTLGVDGMIPLFAKMGMNIEESVAILGAHTLGVTHCPNVLGRLNDQGSGKFEGMRPGFEAFLRLRCPEGSIVSNTSFVLNDPTTILFDNQYYVNAIVGRGVLRIDSEMALDPRTAPVVHFFAADEEYFFTTFSSAFVKLSSSGVLTGNQGVIRKHCNAIN